MNMIPRWFKNLAKKSQSVMKIHTFYLGFGWKMHLFKDFWGTKIWTRTKEVTVPLGFKLVSGFHPAYELMRVGEFEVEETEIISNLLPHVNLFIDIGANLGYYSCLALQKKVPVIAFEPQQQNLSCLFENLTINGWRTNFEVFPIALSEQAGLVTLYGASGPSASLLKSWAGYSSKFKKTVPTNTLDAILTGRFLGQKILVKIDVEGAEFQVLKGAFSVLERYQKPVWLIEICLNEFHPNGQNPDFYRTFQAFWDRGYLAYTATSDLKLVTKKDVKEWLNKNYTESRTFNYLFIDSKEDLHGFFNDLPAKKQGF